MLRSLEGRQPHPARNGGDDVPADGTRLTGDKVAGEVVGGVLAADGVEGEPSRFLRGFGAGGGRVGPLLGRAGSLEGVGPFGPYIAPGREPEVGLRGGFQEPLLRGGQRGRRLHCGVGTGGRDHRSRTLRFG